jgi:protein-disulfide isomerase
MRFIIAILSVLLFAKPVLADNFSDTQKQEIGDVVKAYLLDHPELLQAMIEKLKAKEDAEATAAQNATIATSAKNIFHDDLDGVVGNPKGDVTVVEFLDYNCAWCKRNISSVQELVKKDKNLRVVIKEWPIFGYTSEYAARAATASVKQNKYWEFHQALFAATLPHGQDDSAEAHVAGEAAVEKIAKSVGIDVAKMKVDMKDPAIEANLANTVTLSTALKFTGTPGFLINKNVYPGYLELAAMEDAIAKERSNGVCKDC